jgi:hypothetical protein
MATKGSTVIQAMLKRLAKEQEAQSKSDKARVSVDATNLPGATAAAF